jgi:competence protein ComEC
MRPFIVICTMLCVLYLRIHAWYEWRQSQIEHATQFVVWNAEPLRRTTYYCNFQHRGIQIQVKLKECASDMFRYDGVGGTYRVVGRWNEDVFIATSVIHLGDSWLTRMYRMKLACVALIKHVFPEPESGLMAGFVLGVSPTFSPTMTQIVQHTGTMHILAASGYNVSLVIGLCLPFLVRLFGRRFGIGIMIGLLIIYVCMVGLSPSIVRAGIMGCLLLIAQWFGRKYWALWGLGVTAWLLLLVGPWLIESISFQLSFAATLGVLIGHIPIYLPKFVPSFIRHEAVDSLSTTLYAWIMTMPITLWHFGSVSWWALIANPLLLWMLPPLTYLGFVVVCLGIIWLPVAQFIYWGIEPLMKLFIWWMTILGSGSWGIVQWKISLWLVAGWYAAWIGTWLIHSKKEEL